jgi:hypothetical protein
MSDDRTLFSSWVDSSDNHIQGPLTDLWADPEAQRRLLQAIRDEPRCADHTCIDCYPEDTPMTRTRTALKIAKYTVIGWAVLAVAFLAAAMVFGQDLP